MRPQHSAVVVIGGIVPSFHPVRLFLRRGAFRSLLDRSTILADGWLGPFGWRDRQQAGGHVIQQGLAAQPAERRVLGEGLEDPIQQVLTARLHQCHRSRHVTPLGVAVVANLLPGGDVDRLEIRTERDSEQAEIDLLLLGEVELTEFGFQEQRQQ